MSLIQTWVARYKGAEPISKAHLIESEIQDRVVTRCGRQMEPAISSEKGTAILWAPDVPQCVRCQR